MGELAPKVCEQESLSAPPQLQFQGKQAALSPAHTVQLALVAGVEDEPA